jgi:DNA replication protein DnaC
VSADTLYQQLRGHLHYLKLAAVADALAAALEHAEHQRPGYTEFLAGLLKAEVDATEQRRLQGRLRFSKLPARKTLDQFDHGAQPSLDPRMIDELATLRFIEEKANVLLIGPPGGAIHWLANPSTARRQPVEVVVVVQYAEATFSGCRGDQRIGDADAM